MGKATIASGGTDGLYTVDLDYGSEIITAQVANIDAQIADRQADLTEAETAANDAETALNAATNDVNNAITAYTADPTDANRQAMNAAATEATRLAAEYRNAEARRQSLAAIVLSLQADKSQLESVRTSETRQAWCVDYTEDATSEVATIEVPGEVGTLVIAPGGRSPTAADGRLVARGAQVSYQAYYNAAILPGWQRFIHPYRVGTLSAVDKDADTGTVNLDAATSSANGLQVRDAETITAPIQYMTCNARVFEVGDRVVVNTTGPTIIGFESNPKACDPEYRFFDFGIYLSYSFEEKPLGYYITAASKQEFDGSVWRDTFWKRACELDNGQPVSCIDIPPFGQAGVPTEDQYYEEGGDNVEMMYLIHPVDGEVPGARQITISLLGEFTAEGVSLFNTLEADASNLEDFSEVRPFDFSELPNIAYQGRIYTPVGFCQVITVTETDTERPRVDYANFQALYKSA